MIVLKGNKNEAFNEIHDFSRYGTTLVCANHLTMRTFHQTEEPKSKFKKWAKLGIPLVIAVLFLEIWSVNRLSTFGKKIDELKQTEREIVLQNTILENQIAQKSSLLLLEGQSKSLGFGTTSTIQYIKDINVLAAAN